MKPNYSISIFTTFTCLQFFLNISGATKRFAKFGILSKRDEGRITYVLFNSYAVVGVKDETRVTIRAGDFHLGKEDTDNKIVLLDKLYNHATNLGSSENSEARRYLFISNEEATTDDPSLAKIWGIVELDVSSPVSRFGDDWFITIERNIEYAFKNTKGMGNLETYDALEEIEKDTSYIHAGSINSSAQELAVKGFLERYPPRPPPVFIEPGSDFDEFFKLF